MLRVKISTTITMTQIKVFTFFFNSKKIKQKKWIDYEFILDESYEDYFMKYLVNINQNEDQKYDILTNKNSKFLFYHFNDYLAHINEPTKPVRHSETIDDDFALDIIQNKNWQYFIEKLLEICQSNNSGTLANNLNVKEIKIIQNSIENITIFKQCCFNFYKQTSQNLGNTITNLPPDELDEIDRDLQRNFYFVDFS